MGQIVCPEITEFRDNLSVPSSGGQELLTFENGTDKLSRNYRVSGQHISPISGGQELLTFENGTDSLSRNYRVSGQPINPIFRGSRIIDI